MQGSGPGRYDRAVNHPHSGLYWPSRRALFHRRYSTGARIALWVASAIVAIVAGASYLHAP